jgi:hypothetical protein
MGAWGSMDFVDLSVSFIAILLAILHGHDFSPY